jgi:F-box protein 11
MSEKPNVFVSYSHLDTSWLEQFDAPLKALVNHVNFERFDDRQLLGGSSWDVEIKAALERATIALLLVTANFMASEYIKNVEIQAALRNRKEKGCIVIPVLCRACDWELLQISDIHWLPMDPKRKLKPLAEWHGADRDAGLTQVVKHIRERVEALERGKPSSEPAPSPPQKPQDAPATKPTQEPRTLFVGALHPDDHPTLAAALGAAKAGDRIVIRKGQYNENIVIDKPLEIIGDGKWGDVIIEANSKAAVLFQANMGRISNLTLWQTGGAAFCVDIAQGRLQLERCDITSQGFACVAIHDGADPWVRGNHIHGGNDGIFAYANGLGTLEDNDIYGNGLAGIEIQDGSNPTLRRNRIRDGREGGVYVHKSGKGIFEDNEISANKLAGVAIMDGGNPILRRNSIHDGMANGVYVAGGGQGLLEDNDIFANSYSSVEIKEGGNPTVRHNRIHHGKAGGVMVLADGQGVLEDNEISANAEAGVTIWGGGNPTLRSNRISQNGYAAIRVHEGGRGVFADNDLRGNAGGAWDIAPDCEGSVIRNGNQE